MQCLLARVYVNSSESHFSHLTTLVKDTGLLHHTVYSVIIGQKKKSSARRIPRMLCDAHNQIFFLTSPHDRFGINQISQVTIYRPKKHKRIDILLNSTLGDNLTLLSHVPFWRHLVPYSFFFVTTLRWMFLCTNNRKMSL